MSRISALLTFTVLVLIVGLAILIEPDTDRDISEIRNRMTPELTRDLAASGLSFGAPVYLRVFKEEKTLELWVESEDRFALFRSYPICNYSGALGPKLKEGDRQSPEGFYRVAHNALNPNSNYHLSFNLGFPNAFDRANDRTGSFLMIHGACASIGCYAMTDQGIEEIYVMVEAALNAGQGSVPVHAFPFRMTEARLAKETGTRWHGFWLDLKAGFDAFETTGQPPDVTISNQRYRLADS